MLGQIAVGAVCSCLQREQTAAQTAAPTVSLMATAGSSVREPPGHGKVQVAAQQQSLEGDSASNFQPSHLSGAFSNQAPMLFATEGSVRFAASLLQSTGAEECRTAVREDTIFVSSQEQNGLQGCTDVHTAQDEAYRIDLTRTATKEVDLGEQIMYDVVRRFRVNVVLSRLDAYAEACWETLCIEVDSIGSGERDGLACGACGGSAQQLAPAVIKFAVGEQAVRCKAINVNASSGTTDGKQGGLFGSLRRTCRPGKVVWGVYAWPCTGGKM